MEHLRLYRVYRLFFSFCFSFRPFQDAPMGSCLALWLQLCLGTYDSKSREGALEFTLVDLQETMEDAVRKGRLRTLHLGLQLFLPVRLTNNKF